MDLFKSLANLRRFFAEHPLTRDAPSRAWLRFVSWQVRSRFQAEVLIDWVGGQRLAVRHGMSGATGNIYVGLHEFYDMMVPLHFLRPGDLFLDVGANLGTYTILASGVCRASTLAFEPDRDTLKHLRKNIEVNGIDDLVKVYDCALSSSVGEVSFTEGKGSENRIATKHDKKTRRVRTERLDGIIGHSLPVMMKADVEGAELDVLIGAENLLRNQCLKVIELETVASDAATILARNGFERAYYDPFSRSLSRETLNEKSSNALYVSDWPFVENRLKSAQKIPIFDKRI